MKKIIISIIVGLSVAYNLILWCQNAELKAQIKIWENQSDYEVCFDPEAPEM